MDKKYYLLVLILFYVTDLTSTAKSVNSVSDAKNKSSTKGFVRSTTPKSTTASSSVKPTSVAFAPANVNLIRQCTRNEVFGCQDQAFVKSVPCRQKCGKHLNKLGENTDKMMTCFDDIEKTAKVMHQCVVDNVEGYMNENDTEINMIPRSTYVFYSNPLNFTETAEDSPKNRTFSWRRKARGFFAQFRQFERCVVDCIRDEVVACYNEKSCGVALPEPTELVKVFKKCPNYKRQTFDFTRKACVCLAHKQGVKKLIGSCAHFNPFLMKP